MFHQLTKTLNYKNVTTLAGWLVFCLHQLALNKYTECQPVSFLAIVIACTVVQLVSQLSQCYMATWLTTYQEFDMTSFSLPASPASKAVVLLSFTKLGLCWKYQILVVYLPGFGCFPASLARLQHPLTQSSLISFCLSVQTQPVSHNLHSLNRQKPSIWRKCRHDNKCRLSKRCQNTFRRTPTTNVTLWPTIHSVRSLQMEPRPNGQNPSLINGSRFQVQ